MTGMQLHCSKHCKLPFGSYVQAYEDPTLSNTQAACTVGAICLGPTGNVQGSHKFLSLVTGRCITPLKWTPLPMPQEVIHCINKLGKANKQSALLTLTDHLSNPIGDIVTPTALITGVTDDVYDDDDIVNPTDEEPKLLNPQSQITDNISDGTSQGAPILSAATQPSGLIEATNNRNNDPDVGNDPQHEGFEPPDDPVNEPQLIDKPDIDPIPVVPPFCHHARNTDGMGVRQSACVCQPPL